MDIPEPAIKSDQHPEFKSEFELVREANWLVVDLYNSLGFLG